VSDMQVANFTFYIDLTILCVARDYATENGAFVCVAVGGVRIDGKNERGRIGESER
jgi:hypothetical protein